MKHEDLFSEVMKSPESEVLRRQSLEAGVGAVRFRRRRNAAARWTAPVVLALLAGAFFVSRERPPAHPISVYSMKARNITEEELLAHFPNQAVALVGEPGRQEIVFLDAPP